MSDKFNKWFDAKVAATVFIVSATVSVVGYFTSPVKNLEMQVKLLQQQVESMKNNDIAHLQINAATQTAAIQQIQIDLAKLIVLSQQNAK